MNADKGTQMNADPLLKRLRVAVVAVVASMVVGAAWAATPVPGGKWSFVWTDAKGAGIPMRVYTYRPRACDSNCPMVIVLHGMSRNASTYRDYWELAADRYKVLVVAPEFRNEDWPGTEGYNLGGFGKAAPNKTVFATIEHLFDEMRVDQKTYVLFGHSAGAQVAHRMALLWPDNRASTVVSANAGWYTLPELRKEKVTHPFPYSLVNTPITQDQLKAALGKRVIVMAGENDNDPDADNLNKSDGAMKQGDSRVDRAETFIKTATTAANDMGVKLAWELVEVPGVAHSGSSMCEAAAHALYEKK